jgi:cytochrome c oxidase assembly protein subunit 15
VATAAIQSHPKVAVGLSFAAMALLYSVMLLGVYITASHQGLSCPDWPLCPNGLAAPSEKYFFEHVHRMMVVVTAGAIFATAAYCATRMKQALKTALIAAVLVSVQITLGMLVVTSELEPLLVASHLSTGILLFAMTLMTFLSAYKFSTRSR